MSAFCWVVSALEVVAPDGGDRLHFDLLLMGSALSQSEMWFSWQ